MNNANVSQVFYFLPGNSNNGEYLHIQQTTHKNYKVLSMKRKTLFLSLLFLNIYLKIFAHAVKI